MIIGDFFFEIPRSLPVLEVLSPYYIVFVLVCFLLSRVFKAKIRPVALLLANIFFLYSFSLYHLACMCELALIGYLLSLLMLFRNNRKTLAISVFCCIVVLCLFKYQGLWDYSATVPLGLSYVSFKLISYYADLNNGKTAGTKNLIYFLDYALFFPVMTAGPINRFQPFFDVISNTQEIDYGNVKNGGFQLMLGIFEKRVFCDYLAYISNRAISSGLGGLNVLLGVMLYSFVIYLDFDACSNIAIGTARMLGFSIPKNFNSPYLSATLKEFWTRWHISLSSWFKDYVYIPLGGNRKGKIRQYILILLVFVLSGVWHGSTFNFLIWGILHGVFRIVEDIVLTPFKNMGKVPRTFVRPFGIVLNYLLISFLWLLFRYSSFDQVIGIVSSMFVSRPLSLLEMGLTVNEQYWLCIVLIAVIIMDILRNRFDVLECYAKLWLPLRWGGYLLLIVVFLVFGVYGGNFSASDFIYQYF